MNNARLLLMNAVAANRLPPGAQHHRQADAGVGGHGGGSNGGAEPAHHGDGARSGRCDFRYHVSITFCHILPCSYRVLPCAISCRGSATFCWFLPFSATICHMLPHAVPARVACADETSPIPRFVQKHASLAVCASNAQQLQQQLQQHRNLPCVPCRIGNALPTPHIDAKRFKAACVDADIFS